MTMELCYNPAAGERGLGDLYLPEHPEHAPVALTIHGGGWSAQDKSSFCGVSQFIASLGWAVFNINYRLTTIAPWPACGNDCLMAAKFLLDGEVPEFAGLDRRKLLICGGSAGGHLALMTGLRLPQNRVAGIISISGIDELTSDFALHSFRYKPFFGGEPTEEKQTEANPLQYLRPDSPPVLLTHWDNDQVVPVESARRFRDRGRALGCRVDYYEYSTEDEGHGIWIPDSKPHRLYPHLETELTRFIESVRPENPPCPTK